MPLKIRRLSHALGAEVLGADISKPLDDKSFSEIHSAFLEHFVLLFRGQPLTRQQHVAFSRRFGDLDQNEGYSTDRKAPEFPEITLVMALADYDRTQVRHMERTTVNGVLSGYSYDGPLE